MWPNQYNNQFYQPGMLNFLGREQPNSDLDTGSLELATLDPFRAASYAAYSGGAQMGRGIGELIGTAAGGDTRLPAQKLSDATQQLKDRMAQSENDPFSDDWYTEAIGHASKLGLTDIASNMKLAQANLAKEQAQTENFNRANQPKGKSGLEVQYEAVLAKLADDPENPQLLAAKKNIEAGMNTLAGKPDNTGKWTTHQATQFAPGFQSNDLTGEVRPLPGNLSSASGAAGANSNLTGDDFLATLPAARAAQVKALTEGRLAFPAGSRAMQSPQWQQLLQDVAQYDPNFDAVNYNARNKTRADFTSGKSATSLNALNTVLGHIGDLMQSSQSLNNTNYPWINAPWNWIESKVSPDMKGRLNAFQLNANAVAEELERAYRGTGGNMTEIEAWKKAFDSADSPEAMRITLQKAVGLLNSKIQSLGSQYSQGMGTSEDGLTLLNPHAQDVYNQISGSTPAGNGAQPQQPRQSQSQPQQNGGWSIKRK